MIYPGANDNTGQWYKLDNAGKLFPSIATLRCTTVFRLSATLDHAVDPDLLQAALNHLLPRLNYYKVNLKRGIFWYYLENAANNAEVQKEYNPPCMYLSFLKKGYFPFRILYFNDRISLEIAHFLTDGTGALVFLKSLIAEYFRLNGIECDDKDGLLMPGDNISPDESEDSFKKYYSDTGAKVIHAGQAMHFPFPLIERGSYGIVTGIMPVEKVMSAVKAQGVTLTVFFLALYFETVLEFIRQAPSYLRNEMTRPVTMNVPVNLRSYYPSATMRNFFLSATPSVDPKDGGLTFDKLLETVSVQMKSFCSKENFAAYIKRNVKSEESVLIRLMPLALKDAFMPLIYMLFGENLYTSSISNLGRIAMSAKLEEHIKRFEFYPSPSRGNKIKTAITGFKDKLYFTFGKLTRETVIERIFFRKLIKMGIPVKIETNYKGEL